LILEAGSAEDHIRGRLIHTPLAVSRLQYDALSYVWGDPENQKDIEVDGACYRVSANLFEALWHLRRERVSRVLWADAICINQRDDREKSQQVMMMADIYRNARTVQIWLGPEKEFTAAGIRVLSFLAGSEDITLNIHSEPWEALVFNRLGVAGLKDILDRPWFERCWVVQEATLSKRVTLNVGHLSLSWDESSSFKFLKRIKFAEITPKWRTKIQVDMRNLRELLELGLRVKRGIADSQDSPDLLDVVHEMRHRKVANLRDSIYSVLALARDGGEFKIDYSLSVEETFENLYHYIRLKYGPRWDGNADISNTIWLTNIWRTLFSPFDRWWQTLD
jgi:Heterokaryon incompatibility protein (HET)